MDESENRFFNESAMESTLELPEIFFFSDFFDLVVVVDVVVVVDDVEEDSSLRDGIGGIGSEDGEKCSFASAAAAAEPEIGC